MGAAENALAQFLAPNQNSPRAESQLPLLLEHCSGARERVFWLCMYIHARLLFSFAPRAESWQAKEKSN